MMYLFIYLLVALLTTLWLKGADTPDGYSEGQDITMAILSGLAWPLTWIIIFLILVGVLRDGD